MSDIKLSGVTLDCPNARQLAAFYAVITGGTVTFANDGWATVKWPSGAMESQTVPGLPAAATLRTGKALLSRASSASPNRPHDLDAVSRNVVKLGTQQTGRVTTSSVHPTDTSV